MKKTLYAACLSFFALSMVSLTHSAESRKHCESIEECEGKCDADDIKSCSENCAKKNLKCKADRWL